jgi:hypothetical protein
LAKLRILQLGRFGRQRVGRKSPGQGRYTGINDLARCSLTLNTAIAAACTPGVRVEQPLGARSPHDRVSNSIGMLLILIAGFTDPAFQLHPTALLDDVRRLVSGGMEARCSDERDVVTGRVRLGADRAARDRGITSDVGLDVADVVAAE